MQPQDGTLFVNNSIASKTKIFTPIISTISSFSMVPLPSISYMVNAQFSLLLGSPPDVMLMASRNSLKSILPLLSPSKERKTWLQNLSGFPVGKNVEYTSRNLAFDSNPSGQSLFMEEKKGDTIEENSFCWKSCERSCLDLFSAIPVHIG